jgi:hypothetical protein
MNLIWKTLDRLKRPDKLKFLYLLVGIRRCSGNCSRCKSMREQSVMHTTELFQTVPFRSMYISDGRCLDCFLPDQLQDESNNGYHKTNNPLCYVDIRSPHVADTGMWSMYLLWMGLFVNACRSSLRNVPRLESRYHIWTLDLFQHLCSSVCVM